MTDTMVKYSTIMDKFTKVYKATIKEDKDNYEYFIAIFKRGKEPTHQRAIKMNTFIPYEGERNGKTIRTFTRDVLPVGRDKTNR
jgi:hypothetical protein